VRELLKPEMFVRGTVAAGLSGSERLLVPASAVLWTGERSVVYVKVPDAPVPSFQFREVMLGGRAGEHYLVEEGLEAGEEVVTHGNFVIDAAAQLNNQVSMMNRDVLLKGTDALGMLPDFTDEAPVAFKEQLSALIRGYLALKDALVATDQVSARDAAVQLLAGVPEVDMSLVEGRAHTYWMEQAGGIQAHAEKIAEMDDVEKQREQFDYLSQAIINAIRVFGVHTDTFYIQHCPMAFDNDGADWVSHEREIRNPYFGDKMLKCGIVKDTITRDTRDPKAE
jgi:Cu(I)/Ag(I) efflux system membrane fusion protein